MNRDGREVTSMDGSDRVDQGVSNLVWVHVPRSKEESSDRVDS